MRKDAMQPLMVRFTPAPYDRDEDSGLVAGSAGGKKGGAEATTGHPPAVRALSQAIMSEKGSKRSGLREGA